jgi:hypothetical protein
MCGGKSGALGFAKAKPRMRTQKVLHDPRFNRSNEVRVLATPFLTTSTKNPSGRCPGGFFFVQGNIKPQDLAFVPGYEIVGARE